MASSETHLSPAQYVVHVFGGVRKTARAIGRTPSTISKWNDPKDRPNRSGEVPPGAMKAILAKAKELGLDLTPSDLIEGRTILKEAG